MAQPKSTTSKRRHASAAKLPYSAVEELREISNADRDTFAAYAQKHGVHLETVRRAYKGLTWSRPLVRDLGDDWRECQICSALYSRRRNGRLMTERLWSKKTTCSLKCLYKLRKNQGHVHPFDKQRARCEIPLHTIIEADGHMRSDPSKGLAGRPQGASEADPSRE